jgi:hypothetical protein
LPALVISQFGGRRIIEDDLGARCHRRHRENAST